MERCRDCFINNSIINLRRCFFQIRSLFLLFIAKLLWTRRKFFKKKSTWARTTIRCFLNFSCFEMILLVAMRRCNVVKLQIIYVEYWLFSSDGCCALYIIFIYICLMVIVVKWWWWCLVSFFVFSCISSFSRTLILRKKKFF